MLLSALLFGKPSAAGPDGTGDPDADEPADVRAHPFAPPPPLARRGLTPTPARSSATRPVMSTTTTTTTTATTTTTLRRRANQGPAPR
mgnify:CR=1 FL=1|tara:strand:+ start:233 stop:496 length:264 start_codon:yes stop_codon:yes gene_type:complete